MPSETEPIDFQLERIKREGLEGAAIFPTPAAGLPGDYEGQMEIGKIYPSPPPTQAILLPHERLRIVRNDGSDGTTSRSPLVTEV